MSGTPSARGDRSHTVPAFVLTGFAEPREETGTLCAFDLRTGTYISSTPRNLAVKRGFYRLTAGQDDRDAVDDYLTQVEDHIAPVLRQIEQEQRRPTNQELQDIIWFIAIQGVRTIDLRERFTAIFEFIRNAKLDFSLSSPERWEASCEVSGGCSQG